MDLPSGQIIIVSGHPGSGKTTTAEALAHMPGCPKVHLHTDDFWGNIKTGLIPPWLAESHSQNQMIMEIAAGVAGTYARNGYCVVLDGVIRPWSLPIFLGTGLPVHYMLLRTSVDEAVGRCMARGGDSLSDAKIVAQLHSEFMAMGGHESHVLNVDGLAPTDVASRVFACAMSGDYRLWGP